MNEDDRTQRQAQQVSSDYRMLERLDTQAF
jgi:hypothetical protein